MILRTRLFTKCAQPRLMAMVAVWWHNGISWERLESDLMQRMSNEELDDRCQVGSYCERRVKMWRHTNGNIKYNNTEYLTTWRQKTIITKEISAIYKCAIINPPEDSWACLTTCAMAAVSEDRTPPLSPPHCHSTNSTTVCCGATPQHHHTGALPGEE